MASLAVFLVSVAQAQEGADRVSDEHLLFARSLGAAKYLIIHYIILPGGAVLDHCRHPNEYRHGFDGRVRS